MVTELESARPPTWAKRVADEVEAIGESAEAVKAPLIEAILESAGEMKAGRAKILLGRCYEILRTLSKDPEPGLKLLMEEIAEEIRS